ncbi:MAG: DUF2807 domain-containing protein [Candidatus Peribacteria bacterium]|nr:DUF2807 domain-containing protein [Candidatus Peribacteria bacterium]
MGGPFTVNFTQSDTNEIKITTDEALLKCITAEENAGKFSLSHKGNCFWFGRRIPKITVDVSFQQLKGLDLGGASSAYTLTPVLLNEHLLLKVSGASAAELDITAPKIQADIS